MTASYDKDSGTVHATVTDAVMALQRSLRALTAPADEIFMNWREGSQHPDWHLLEGGLFDVFVRNFVNASREWSKSQYELAPYGIRVESYRGASWLCPLGEQRLALVQFESVSEPFDHLRFVNVDDFIEHRWPIDEAGEITVGITNDSGFKDKVLTHLTVVD